MKFSPRSAWRDRQNRKRFLDAQSKCGPDQMVCATVKPTGEPVYFVVDRSLPDDAIQDRAFAIRNERSITPGERTLLAYAAKRMKEA